MRSSNVVQSELPWWKRTTVYQIYPRSFSDQTGDGVGDLAGIIERLDYVRWLGLETIWLSPFFSSPQADFGYDISDHFGIAPEYGSQEDCRRLIDEIHARGMKVVFDMVLNHTSDQHAWFLESRGSRDNPYRDFYIWRDGRKPYGGAPPNNWRSMLGGSGWHYDAQTDQWYWASFLPFQPDLNYRNSRVKGAMLDVVRHWLREGADGLRLDIFNAIYKDAAFADNPRSLRAIPSEDNPGGFFQRALHTQNHPDTFAFARELRAVVDEFDNPSRFIVGEVFGSADLLREYCGPSGEGLNLVFLFKSLRTPFRARAFRDLVDEFESAFPEPLHPTYVFGNHDRPRQMERLGNDLARARLLATFQMTVRGVPFVYYGDELGLSHHDMPREAARDPLAERFRFIPKFLLPALRRRGILTNRDECRSPMPWHGGPHAGFSPPDAPETWLPLHPQHAVMNVAAQREDQTSVLTSYRRMLRLRGRSLALSAGHLELIEPRADANKVFAYRRLYEDGERQESAEIFLNFSKREVPIDLRHLPGGAEARLYSNLHDVPITARGRHLLRPWEGAVVLRDHSE
ncbi:MAG: alpha-amylase family glycosyl hydrolase [Polyangiales bacterium]